jgi:threonine dehydrogenase-like Zn-dependent dehydrogenase
VPGTIIGHEAVGVVEEVGAAVTSFKRGDRVLLSAVLGCGSCCYCQSGYFAQCDDINPNGPRAGSSFYGAPAASGPLDGLQAEYARVSFAHTNMVRLPDTVSDEQAIPISDIYPTGYFGAVIANVTDGDTVATGDADRLANSPLFRPSSAVLPGSLPSTTAPTGSSARKLWARKSSISTRPIQFWLSLS